MPSATNRHDVHHHVIPEFFKDAVAKGGYTATSYRPYPEWSPEISLALMDRAGVEKAYLSFSAPGIYFGDKQAACELGRRCNEYLAGLTDAHADRFGAFAVLPLPDIDGALAEIEHALDELKLDGIGLMTQVGGQYQGNAEFEPVYAELNKRKRPIFIHPTYLPKTEAKDMEVPDAIIEYPFDTTRTVANMIFTGLLERHPDLRFILPHGGGCLPFLANRIQIFDHLPKFRDNFPRGSAAYLRRLYYDTAVIGDSAPIGALQAMAGPSQILFGTDYPYLADEVILDQTAGTDAHGGFDQAGRRMMEHENAEKLFAVQDA
jgi:predicted TIM-barrel fold metal-dependent hydrolase